MADGKNPQKGPQSKPVRGGGNSPINLPRQVAPMAPGKG